MILIEDIVSITPRDVGLGYYIVLKDGNKIKVTRKRDVFPLLLLIHYQKCNHLEITDELKKEVSDKLGHIKDIVSFSRRCNYLDGFDELRKVDHYDFIYTQNINGKTYYLLTKSLS